MSNVLSLAIEELYRIFHFLNDKYYDNYLPVPIITIQSGARKKAQGWFTNYKAWANAETEEDFYEINISAEYLSRGIHAVITTLQHELVHYQNQLLEVKDHSDNVHNKKFKTAAEKVDLIVEKSNSYGWGITSPNEKFIALIDNEIQPKAELFQVFRRIPQVPKAPKTQFKYECPGCEIKAYAKEGLFLKCGSCETALVMEDSE